MLVLQRLPVQMAMLFRVPRDEVDSSYTAPIASTCRLAHLFHCRWKQSTLVEYYRWYYQRHFRWYCYFHCHSYSHRLFAKTTCQLLRLIFLFYFFIFNSFYFILLFIFIFILAFHVNRTRLFIVSSFLVSLFVNHKLIPTSDTCFLNVVHIKVFLSLFWLSSRWAWLP